MDRLLKHALDSDAVSFINRFKGKMAEHKREVTLDLTRTIAADMAGVTVMEAKQDSMHVFVYSSGKGIKWRTSDQRTGGEASFSDPKDEGKLRAYFQKVLGSKTFTLEVRESEDEGEMECEGCGEKYKGEKGKCPKCKDAE